jgi:hypothetical protein
VHDSSRRLAEADALDHLLKQSQVKHDKANNKNGKLIIARLSYHAIAITQAGSYITQRKIQLQQFMFHYNRQRKDILQQTPQMTQYRRKLSDTAGETALNVLRYGSCRSSSFRPETTSTDTRKMCESKAARQMLK